MLGVQDFIGYYKPGKLCILKDPDGCGEQQANTVREPDPVHIPVFVQNLMPPLFIPDSLQEPGPSVLTSPQQLLVDPLFQCIVKIILCIGYGEP
jgi:hypothetical protein